MRVAVLGAGLQGSCIALDLAARGVQVDLYDREPVAMSRTSAHNEAKLHLGFFYGNDRSFRTARLLAHAGSQFAPLLRRWLGDSIDTLPASRPYIYAVHRDSILSADEIAHYLAACAAFVREAAGPNSDYFGVDLQEPPRRTSLEGLNPALVRAAFWTPEVAVSAGDLAGLVRRRLGTEPDVHCLFAADVISVAANEDRALVRYRHGGVTSEESYDHVVNALWEGRLAVDATMGIRPARPWLYRLKYAVRLPPGDAPPLPSVSIVLGAFGDVARYANGEAYLSWYESGIKAVTTGLAPPPWPDRLLGAEGRAMRDLTIERLGAVVPAVAGLAEACRERAEVNGGIIFAWGETDITDPASELHARFDIGPRSYGRYHSVDTGKLVTAPLFAVEVADRITAD
jgi:hypothetical protein